MRDFFIHLPIPLIKKILINLKNSNCRYFAFNYYENVDVNKVVSGIHSDITGLSQTQKQSLSEEQKVKMGFSNKPPSMRRPIKPVNKFKPQITPAKITKPVPIMDANVGEISGSSTI